MKILAYSDLHHAYYSNGLTLADTLAIEDEVLRLANVHKVDLIVCCGDRFADRNPTSSIRIAADLRMKQICKELPVLLLMGNHDREFKSPHSGHSSSYLKEIIHENLIVADQYGIWVHPKVPDVDFYCIPAGQMQNKIIVDTSSRTKICLFHDILIGSKLDSGIKSPFGIDISKLDHKEFTIILGGDNHVPQELPFKNTMGLYIGAPMMHNWGDVGQERGFVLIEIDSQAVRYTRIRSSAPRFIEIELKAGDLLHRDDLAGNIVRIKMAGDIRDINKLDITKIESEWHKAFNTRSLKIITEPTIEFKALVPALAASTGVSDDWNIYINSGHADLKDADPDRVKALGLEILSSIS